MHQPNGRKIFIVFIFWFLFMSCTSESGSGDSGSSDLSTSGLLIINEIVAKDKNGGYDWIELHNTSNESINLGDYSLKDDDSKDATDLPTAILESGDFIVIYATEDVSGDFYIPFNLGSEDGVTLLKNGSAVDRLDWQEGKASRGFSYGLLGDSPQTLTPTLASTNKSVSDSSLVINEVVPKDADDSDDWVELYNIGEDAVNLSDYSLVDDNDDQEPIVLTDYLLEPGEFVVIYACGDESGDFTVPFKLGSNDSVTLFYQDSAVDSLDWKDNAAPSGYSYGLLEDGTGEAQKLLPTKGYENFGVFDNSQVVEVRFTLNEEDWASILANPMAEEYKSGSIQYNGVTVENVGIRTKGHSSLSSVAHDPDSDRYSFKVDFNLYVSGQDFVGYQKLAFNNGHNDPSFMKEFLVYQLSREIGLKAPHATFVNLYINDELFGLYTAVEVIDDEFVEDHFDVDDGDLYQPDGPGSDLLYISDDIDDYFGLDLETNTTSSDQSAIMAMITELNSGSDYESVIDVHSVLKYVAISSIITNLDSYIGPSHHNYYLYEQDGVFSMIPWDFNESFGTFNMGGCTDDELLNFMIDEPTSSTFSDRPLISKLLENSDYLSAYHGYLEELIYGSFDPDNMELLIAETADRIRIFVDDDPTKFFTTDDFEDALINNSDIEGTFGLQYFIENRVSSIINQLNGTAPASGDGSGNCSGIR